MMVSYDRGRSFRDRRRLPEGIDGPVRCKPILLPGGNLLAGSSTEYDGWRVHLKRPPLWRTALGHLAADRPHQRQDRIRRVQPTFDPCRRTPAGALPYPAGRGID